ncbi:glycosyltransferase [Azospirillum sp. SYSU D00513]|uniref:glycosyltransferase family protein n=1 Tax=Azospirillum sp. SYSU D00513 TaxID=2812561 RepID=UPI001FFFA9E3|nr:glycosyltransferase [Azospirillum sp. SYSU D00513]
MRIVQLETFYRPYLDRFYAAHPEVKALSFQQQTRALLDDGFSALHNIVPYLEPLGYEAHFIIGNCGPTQTAWMRERGRPIPPPAAAFHDIIRQQIDEIDPDILYCSDSTSFDSRFIRTLRRRPHLVMGWHAAPIPQGTDWSDFDVLLSGLAGIRDMAVRLGAKAGEKYMPGFPEWIADRIGDVSEKHDVLFAGSYTPVQHARRNELLGRIAETAETGAFDCAFHLSGPAEGLPPAIARHRREAVFGVAMHQALRTGRIVFDCRSSMAALGPDGRIYDIAGAESANMRLFEATGSGAFLLTHHYDNLEEYFRIGEEIETFHTEGEMFEKICYYLDRPEERRAIAERGRMRCLAEHGISHRIHAFDEIVRRHLPARSSTGTTASLQSPETGATMAEHCFCTYFDSGYAPRGLLMLESLLKHAPEARVFVLCLDDKAARIVRERQPSARVITLSDLETFDPDLAAVKQSRSAVEYYFTCTPCLPRYVLSQVPSAVSVTYLDADLLFYESPQRVFAEIGAASIAIVPHRFAPALADRARFGIYNVAWVTWRNDIEGRRCLEDYRRDCLAWCYDRLEDQKFADQKYLDNWPLRYRSIHAIAGKGMNLGPWNLDNYNFEAHEGTLRIEGEPLVFYHFHGLKQVGAAAWDTGLRHYGVRNAQLITETLYRPYVKQLTSLFGELAQAYGLPVPGDRRFGPGAKQAAAPNAISTGHTIIDRQQALAITGEAWHFPDVSERQDAAYIPLLQAMHAGRVRVDLAVAAEAIRATALPQPELLEVGCGSGYYSEVFGHLLNDKVRYTGLDYSQSMIDMACRRYPKAHFLQGDATNLPFEDGSFDIVFNGVSLMHILGYRDAIAQSRRVARRFCVFHTVPVLMNRETTYLRKLAYGRPVAEVIFNEQELLSLFSANGLAPIRVWDSMPYNLQGLLGEPTGSRTYLCEIA